MMKKFMKTSKAKRGEVWFAYDEQGKLRPYIVISNDPMVLEIAPEDDFLMAKVTSKPVRNRFDIPIQDWKEAGLNKPSIVRCYKLRTIHKDLLDFCVGSLTEHDLERVIETIKSYF